MLQCVGIFYLEMPHLPQTLSLGAYFLPLLFKSIGQLCSVENETAQFMATLGKAVVLFNFKMNCILAFIRAYPEIVLI